MIVTIRTVLWYVMSLAGTLLILVALFTDKWLEGTYQVSPTGVFDAALDSVNSVMDGDLDLKNLNHHDVGLFIDCKVPEGQKFFQGECIPNWETFKDMFPEDFMKSESTYPHAWRGAVICFVFGLLLMVLTDLFALLTICCRRCICCSVFTVCGSLQSFAAILFTLGLVAYPVGWGTEMISNKYCAGESRMFVLGDHCDLGFAFWLAVAGTVCTMLASSLAVWAYQSTKSEACDERIDRGEKYICLA